MLWNKDKTVQWKGLGRAFQMALVVKNISANAGVVRDTSSIPRSGRSSGGRRGNTFQYSCWDNPMDRGGWWATVHGVAKRWTQLKSLSMQGLGKGWK